MRLAFTLILLASAPAWASSVDAQSNCDQQVAQSGGPAQCETRPDGRFARVTEADLLTIDLHTVPAEHVLGCSDVTNPAKRPRAGLSPAQLASLDGHGNSDGILIDATINDVRYVFAAADGTPLRWEANPDRVTLTLPGDSAPTVALVDVEQGPTRYCMESKVFVIHAKSTLAASVQVQSNPATQEITSGDTVFLQVKTINNGTVALAPVSVTSSLVGTCARSISSLGAGYSYTYTCSKPNVTAPFSNTVTATGMDGSNSVSATATSTVTLGGGGGPGPTSTARYNVCRLPWAQYAKPGESARWQFKLTNNQSTALSGVTVIETSATQCNKTLATVAIGQTVVWECAQPITAGPPIRTFTFRAFAQEANGATSQDWEFTNVVITDYIHVGGFDGCVANGTSSELCLPNESTSPQMRRTSP